MEYRKNQHNFLNSSSSSNPIKQHSGRQHLRRLADAIEHYQIQQKQHRKSPETITKTENRRRNPDLGSATHHHPKTPTTHLLNQQPRRRGRFDLSKDEEEGFVLKNSTTIFECEEVSRNREKKNEEKRQRFCAMLILLQLRRGGCRTPAAARNRDRSSTKRTE
ncbi:hypothetical protein GmHk_06G014742 [Glycine max]|nr:hypothetical protein GmHk_06G014742 [Glycine max]